MSDNPTDNDPGSLSQESTLAYQPTQGEPGRIGPYRLIQKVGEGGMGEVWQAEQTEPIRRRVALKIIKQGMDTAQIIARFEHERQALALMDHPCVAKVFEAGTTPAGRPYFVMEFVQGLPIGEHCDRHRLSISERLVLFAQVCHGVQHAHQKAIIHRDLKPSNVLVSIHGGKAVPIIIDFGVAKATSQPLTEKSLFTELGAMIGTPEYMSPEQADLATQDVDTRTDVYSLGVMLYQLLVGVLPFESHKLRRAGVDGMRRMIREAQIPKPSTRLNSLEAERSTDLAQRRRTDVHGLRRQLSGDLDWVTMKAMEKDRTRRYGSPAELAADLLRHLRHEPVVAGPPSAAYRAGKFVRRHRVGVAVAVAAVVVPVAFAVAMAAQASRIAREAEAKGRIAEFLREIFRVSEPGEARGNSITARELLDKGAVRIRETLKDEPVVRADLMAIIGDVYTSLGLYGQAEPLLREAMETRRRVLGPDDPQSLAFGTAIGVLYNAQGRYQEAESLLVEMRDSGKRVNGPRHPETLKAMLNLSNTYSYQGRYEESEALNREVLEIEKQVLGPEHPETLNSMHNLASSYSEQGRYAEAEALGREVLDIKKRVLGPEHPDTLRTMHNLAIDCAHQGRFAEAEALYRETLAIKKRVLGPEHPDTLLLMSNLALGYDREHRYADAQSLLRETIEIQKRTLGPEHPETLASKSSLASTYRHQGHYAESESMDRETLETQKRVLGAGHPDTLNTLYNLACTAALGGDRAGALRYLRDAADHGYARPAAWMKDSDFTMLRGDPAFEALIAMARRNQEKAAAKE